METDVGIGNVETIVQCGLAEKNAINGNVVLPARIGIAAITVELGLAEMGAKLGE